MVLQQDTYEDISHKDHLTNEEVCAKIQQAIGPQDLTIVNRCKLQWYGHVSRSSGKIRLARHSDREKKTLLTGKEVGRQRQKMDRPGVRQVPEGSGKLRKKKREEETSCKVPCGVPTTPAVKV